MVVINYMSIQTTGYFRDYFWTEFVSTPIHINADVAPKLQALVAFATFASSFVFSSLSKAAGAILGTDSVWERYADSSWTS